MTLSARHKGGAEPDPPAHDDTVETVAVTPTVPGAGSPPAPVAGDVPARVDRAALELFTARGFDAVTADEVAEAAGISRRTFFRYFPTKADAVWGDFAAHVAHLDALLSAASPDQQLLTAICAAYVRANDYPAADQELLRKRMRLILTEPALQAHSQLRYADVDRVVAQYVGRRTGAPPDALVPRLVASGTRAAATTAFQVWLADPAAVLAGVLHAAFDELAAGFPSLDRHPMP